MSESVRGIVDIKIHAAEMQRSSGFGLLVSELGELRVRLYLIASLATHCGTLLISLGPLAVLCLGGLLVIRGQITNLLREGGRHGNIHYVRSPIRSSRNLTRRGSAGLTAASVIEPPFACSANLIPSWGLVCLKYVVSMVSNGFTGEGRNRNYDWLCGSPECIYWTARGVFFHAIDTCTTCGFGL